MNILLVILLTAFVSKANFEEIDYYWRDYNGKIPLDAFPAGEDNNGRETYIGQGYIHGHGIFLGQIAPPNHEIQVACDGIRKTDHVIKILCSQNSNQFAWLRTTKETFESDTIGKHLVVGGYDYGWLESVIHIGRAMHQGVLKIGQVFPRSALLRFIHNNRVVKLKSFEILLYKNQTDEFV